MFSFSFAVGRNTGQQQASPAELEAETYKACNCLPVQHSWCLVSVCVPQLIQSEQPATVMSSVLISYGGWPLALNGIAFLYHFRTSNGNFEENL